jgi:hypothetical protein
MTVVRPGSGTTNLSVSIIEGRTNHQRIVLPASPANLIRNGDLDLKWLQPAAPDCWTKTSFGWEGEIIPLVDGQRYELAVKFRPGTDGTATARWTRQLPYTLPQNATLPKIDSSPLTPANSKLEFTGSPSMALLQVSIRTKRPPEEVCESIQLIALPAAGR